MKAVVTVQEYLNLFPEPQRKCLEKIRGVIQQAAPEAEEIISYGMPAYRMNGMLVYFGGFKNHCSFFPGSYAVIREFSEQLKNFKTSKGTIQFPFDQSIPSALITKMVKSRIKENQIKRKAKADKKLSSKTNF